EAAPRVPVDARGGRSRSLHAHEGPDVRRALEVAVAQAERVDELGGDLEDEVVDVLALRRQAGDPVETAKLSALVVAAGPRTSPADRDLADGEAHDEEQQRGDDVVAVRHLEGVVRMG